MLTRFLYYGLLRSKLFHGIIECVGQGHREWGTCSTSAIQTFGFSSHNEDQDDKAPIEDLDKAVLSWHNVFLVDTHKGRSITDVKVGWLFSREN